MNFSTQFLIIFCSILPQKLFLHRISTKLNCEKKQRKSPKPLWFRTFLLRYLNRFALLCRGAEKDITNQVLNNTADRRRFQDCHSRYTERCYFHHYKQK